RDADAPGRQDVRRLARHDLRRNLADLHDPRQIRFVLGHRQLAPIGFLPTISAAPSTATAAGPHSFRALEIPGPARTEAVDAGLHDRRGPSLCGSARPTFAGDELGPLVPAETPCRR